MISSSILPLSRQPYFEAFVAALHDSIVLMREKEKSTKDASKKVMNLATDLSALRLAFSPSQSCYLRQTRSVMKAMKAVQELQGPLGCRDSDLA